jgi:hypothetical protein
MTEKYPTALLRVEWPAGKRLIVTHITAMDEDGRPVTLKVLSVTPEPPPISKDPEAWQQGFDAALRGLSRKSNPYPPSASADAWRAGFIDGKATLLDD